MRAETLATRSKALIRVGIGLAALSISSPFLVAGCSNIVGGVGGTPPGNVGPMALQPTGQLDLLLVVDNSSSMSDKQHVFAASLRGLLSSLTNPPCVNSAGDVHQPATPEATCPAGLERLFAPLRSIHLGVVSSSLGGLGADTCTESDLNRNNNDHARLLRRAEGGGTVPTYLDYGFLAWDPDGELSPPGESDFEAYVAHAIDLVNGAGEVGCGYEMPLESAYRFLVDPSPYASIQKEGGGSFPTARISGLDTYLLADRAHFLREGSLVSVVLLSDENDCSFQTGTRDAGSQDYAVLDAAPFFRGSSDCKNDPSSSCCYSCGLAPPADCVPDSVCDEPRYEPQDDPPNLRCWRQKQRYGLDFLYPTDRYVNAFSQAAIAPDASSLSDPTEGANVVPNPLFAAGRDPKLVFFTSIVGVPWQTIAVDPNRPSEGVLDSEALRNLFVWSAIVGNPSSYIDPTDPLMIESTTPRPGVSSMSPNGGDRPIDLQDDLQYACIFPLPNPIPQGSDCLSGSAGNPICEGQEQTAAKAYPGLRELAVVEGLGAQGIVGSICSPAIAPTDDSTSALYGYHVVFDSLVRRMASSLTR